MFRVYESAGLLEPCADLGDEVKAGYLTARVHDIRRTGLAPDDYHAGIDGIFTERHFRGLIAMGDFPGVIAVPM